MIGKLSDLEFLNIASDGKLNGDYSDKYKTTLQQGYRYIIDASNGDNITLESITTILNRYASATSYNTL